MAKTVNMSFEGKTCRKLAYGQNINDSEKKKALTPGIHLCPPWGNILAYILVIDHDSPAQNQFDLELWYKVFFFTDSCRLDIAIKDSG